MRARGKGSKESGSSTPRPTCHHSGFSEDTKCELPGEGRERLPSDFVAESSQSAQAPV